MHTDTLIIGGGLSGLALGAHLQAAGQSYHILEARSRIGGRIHTARPESGGYFDLGPAWFWPYQPRMEALCQRFNLTVFEQYSEGALVFENEFGTVQHGRGFASMAGSLRIEGGMAALIDGYSALLPASAVSTGVQALKLTHIQNSITVETNSPEPDLKTIQAKNVVLALPPRVAAHTLSFLPALPSEALTAMHAVPTWMAGHAKVMALYDTPFWRKDGLSGDAQSRRGPLMEIHDASPLTRFRTY